jgi:transposase
MQSFVGVQRLWGRRRGWSTIGAGSNQRSSPVPQPNDLSRSLVPLQQDSTLVAVIELSQSNWLVAGIVPGLERHPLKKLDANEEALLALLQRWQDEAAKAGQPIARVTVAFEAGRDGFWLARWLRARGIEAHVIHPTSVAVSREHRRAKTDRLDTELLKRAFMGWLRGEPDHCSMAAVPTLEEEDAKRPSRERENLVGERTRIVNRMKGALARLGVRNFKLMLRTAPERLEALRTPEGAALPPNTLAELRRDLARLVFVKEQIKQLEAARLERLERASGERRNAMVLLLARVVGVGVETADMLVNEVLSRSLRDRKAVARYAGLTGSPSESGTKRRERGLAKAGNARVRRGMLQLAWRFLRFQEASDLAQWYRTRTADARGATRKTMIVALARKLLIALWRLATTGEASDGIVLRPAT